MATKDDNEVRLSHDLSEGEINATKKRREKVLMCLKNLEISCGQNDVPNIVVLGSGGGLRAMVALLGTLVELKKQNFLDAVMYLCGVSGSTWLTFYAMRRNDIWELEPFYLKAHVQHVNDMPGLFITLKCMSILYEDRKWSENLMCLEEELCESLSKSWDIMRAIEYLEESSKDELYSLTDFWASCVVYQILKQFDENELADHKEASETGINPYPIYAAVDKDKLKEKGRNFPGLWGSAIGSMEENLKFIRGSVRDVYNMVYKTIQCALTWEWGKTNNFLYNCCDIQPPYLVKNKTMSLIDAGLAINSAYPLVLRAQRRADLIISFDFSAGDPFETINATAIYCQENRIPFPKIEDKKMDKDHPSDCYVFRGDNACPTVMHFPLFNTVNCFDKIEEYRASYSTFNMSFTKEHIKDLLEKARLNVSNNSGRILDEIKWLVPLPHANKF